VCPNRDWFSNLEILDGCFVIMGDDRPCNMEGIRSFLVKIFDGMVRELKKVKYIPQTKKNLISVSVLEALCLEISGRDSILICLCSMVVMEGV